MPRSDPLCAIPARYRSSRFPGKPLTPIRGVPMVVRVAQSAMQAMKWVVVATEDERIAKACREHGIDAVMTGDSHPTGTDRVAEAAARLEPEFVVNVQGDEPLLPVAHLRRFAEQALAAPTPVTNAMSPLPPDANVADVTVPKVVATPDRRLVYISRSVVPNADKGVRPAYFRQLGLYGFTADALRAYARHGRGSIERSEDVEILRFLDLGVPVTMVELADYGPAVDLPEHVALVEARL
jgi:3-deoxy-manno-octulosonate cytidylyltransferase (CMP-KDO synthetase)